MCLSVCILWGIKTGYQNGLFHRLWNRRDLNRMEDTLKLAIERGQVRGGAVIPAQTSHGPRVLKVWDTETIPTEGVPFSTDLCALAEVDGPRDRKGRQDFL